MRAHVHVCHPEACTGMEWLLTNSGAWAFVPTDCKDTPCWGSQSPGLLSDHQDLLLGQCVAPWGARAYPGKKLSPWKASMLFFVMGKMGDKFWTFSSKSKVTSFYPLSQKFSTSVLWKCVLNHWCATRFFKTCNTWLFSQGHWPLVP